MERKASRSQKGGGFEKVVKFEKVLVFWGEEM